MKHKLVEEMNEVSFNGYDVGIDDAVDVAMDLFEQLLDAILVIIETHDNRNDAIAQLVEAYESFGRT